MSKPIVLKEYEQKNHSQTPLGKRDLEELQKYIDRQKLSSALNITPNWIKAKSCVGVIKYKNIHLQILPKLICANDKTENILKNLIFMLSYTRKLEIKTSNADKLYASENPFIEILIREYAKSLSECLKRLTPKNYISEEDNLTYLKGKIKFAENIRHNSCNQTKFYCEYDEFSENNALNQLFLFVSECLYNISKDSHNRKILKFIINYYSEVDLVRFDRFSAETIRLSRNQELFRKPFMLAKMFIEKTSVDMSKNRFDSITMLWDMNKLFEEFVFEIMKRMQEELQCRISAQKPAKLLKEKQNDGNFCKKRDTFVDIMAEKDDGEKIVLDTKYKEFHGFDDAANSDIFQVSAYCLLHNAKHAVLIYPRYDEKDPSLSEYFLNTDENAPKIKIGFKTINLKHESLKDSMEQIRQEILGIFKN